LPAIAFVVAVAAALLLVLKSPFPWPMIGLILLGHFFLFEYSVMARNYGIAMLVLFAVATYYPAYRSRGIVLGVWRIVMSSPPFSPARSCYFDWWTFSRRQAFAGRSLTHLRRHDLPDLQRRRRAGLVGWPTP
jgi:hypothetical protein